VNIVSRDGRWVVTMDWPEVNEAYEDGSPVEQVLSAVAEENTVDREQLRSSIVRATGRGMSVVVERGESG
jgi:hypothetical protein